MVLRALLMVVSVVAARAHEEARSAGIARPRPQVGQRRGPSAPPGRANADHPHPERHRAQEQRRHRPRSGGGTEIGAPWRRSTSLLLLMSVAVGTLVPGSRFSALPIDLAGSTLVLCGT